MRLFLAVSAGERFVAELTPRLAAWRPRLDVRWSRPETWHLTLQFLGEWPPERAERLIDALQQADFPPRFDLEPGRLDGFPDLRAPRVLFLQMDDDGSCARLAAAVRETVERIWPDGPQDRRSFRSHLTLARVRGRLASEQRNRLEKMDLGRFEAIPVEAFRLVRSDLRPEGPHYTELAVFPLRKKGE